jgi:hypothetical protein
MKEPIIVPRFTPSQCLVIRGIIIKHTATNEDGEFPDFIEDILKEIDMLAFPLISLIKATKP